MLDPRSENMISILQNLADEGFDIIENIKGDSTQGLSTADLYYDYLFEMIRSEFDSLESIEDLVEEKKFKDCFTLLRTRLEVLLFFWLMVHGKKYRFLRTLTITTEESSTPKEARDKTLEQWREGKKAKKPNYENIISMEAFEDDKIKVLYEWEGLYDKQDKKLEGYYIPWYFFVLTEHYNQYVRFNSELPSIKTGSMIPKERAERHLHEQSVLYSKYIYIDAIIKNLALNNLVTDIQTDYIKVHYNFLSSYVHPTKEMFQFIERYSGFISSDVPDEIVTEQIWLYVCRIQYLLLKILLERIDNYNPKADTEKYKTLIQKLEHASSYFWFIDNEPTSYDRFVSEQNKKFALKFGSRIADEVIMYYENPLQRLQSFKSSHI